MRKTFDKLLKEKVVNDYQNNKNASAIARTYGISRSTVFLWAKQFSVHCDKQTKVTYQYSDILNLQRIVESLQHDIMIYQDAMNLFSIPLKKKLEILESLFGKYPVKTMCRVLNVDHSTFYNYHFRRVVKTQNQIRNEFLKKEIMKVFFESDQRFGSNKITVKLHELGVNASQSKVKTLMNELNIKSRQTKKKTFFPKPSKQPGFPNRLHREFEQQLPNKFWVSDITQIKTGYVSSYLCVIIDLFSRKVIAYRLSSQNNDKLTINTFKDAFELRNRPQGLTFHSDRGTTYLSNAFCDLLKFYAVTQSCSKAANPYDNAVVEAFFSNFKREEINSHSYADFKELEDSVDDYIRFYNDYRPHESLKNKTPNQVESSFFKHEKIGQSE